MQLRTFEGVGDFRVYLVHVLQLLLAVGYAFHEPQIPGIIVQVAEAVDDFRNENPITFRGLNER